MYNINYVYLLNGNDALLQKWVKIVEDEMEEYKKAGDMEKYFISMFYKGVLLKHAKQYKEATNCFQAIINE